jgi:hypothetical protein
MKEIITAPLILIDSRVLFGTSAMESEVNRQNDRTMVLVHAKTFLHSGALIQRSSAKEVEVRSPQSSE